ncbi:MAG: hypothetical protein ACPGVU_27135, partial [Limisphaerales bacterium]
SCFTVPIPTAHYTADSRINLTKKKADKLSVGETTREEVLLAFGEPDHMTPDGSKVIYHWSRTYVQFFTGFQNGDGLRDDFGRDFNLTLHFADDGVLKNREFSRSILDHQKQADW